MTRTLPATDVAVLGGGPAGAATALALRRHAPALDVALVEASAYGETRIGESLSPNARPLLVQLGVFDRFLAEGHHEAFGTTSSWGGDLADNDYVATPHGHGWHLDRRRFDAFLAGEASNLGVALYRECRVAGEARSSHGWKLELRCGAGTTELETRFVVDATGRGARFAGRRGARRVLFDWLVGVFLFFEDGDRPVPEDTRTLVEPVELGWWYSARLPDGLVAAFMTDSDLVRREGLDERAAWLELLEASRHTRERVSGLGTPGEPSVHAAASGRLDVFSGDGWLAVGDAASTFDPLSGQGIVKALANGRWAAFAVADALERRPRVHERYEHLMTREFESFVETRDAFYAEERRWPESPFWRRRRLEITLDPRNTLVRATAAPPLERLRMYLPAAELGRLADLFAEPRPAHEAAALFKNGTGGEDGAAMLSDRRIVLALQYLVDEGVLTRREYPPGT